MRNPPPPYKRADYVQPARTADTNVLNGLNSQAMSSLRSETAVTASSSVSRPCYILGTLLMAAAAFGGSSRRILKFFGVDITLAGLRAAYHQRANRPCRNYRCVPLLAGAGLPTSLFSAERRSCGRERHAAGTFRTFHCELGNSIPPAALTRRSLSPSSEERFAPACR
jgi:hypothetical protein